MTRSVHAVTAFAELYAAHHAAIVRYGLRRLGEEAAARDVAGETFAIAWQRWDRVPRDAPLPWLYGVARNLVASEYRRQVRVEDLTRRLVEQRRQAGWEEDSADRLERVLSGLGSLSSSDQEVLRLHAWEGLRGKSLAYALGCSVTAAAVRLHRARARLRRALSAYQDDWGAAPSATATHRPVPKTSE